MGIIPPPVDETRSEGFEVVLETRARGLTNSTAARRDRADRVRKGRQVHISYIVKTEGKRWASSDMKRKCSTEMAERVVGKEKYLRTLRGVYIVPPAENMKWGAGGDRNSRKARQGDELPSKKNEQGC